MTGEIVTGDARKVLAGRPGQSVHCCVTSPPYWGLRKYAGGWRQCVLWGSLDDFAMPRKHPERWWTLIRWRACRAGGVMSPNGKSWIGALGLEPTPELYIAHLVECFRAVKRVLRDDGTLWINIGDKQAAVGGPGASGKQAGRCLSASEIARGEMRTCPAGLKPKDQVGIPWMLAFALRADGWYWRDTIVWAKGVSFCKGWSGSVMPESIRDRPTKAWEPILLFSKSKKCVYDWFAAREAANGDTHAGRKDGNLSPRYGSEAIDGNNRAGTWKQTYRASSRNWRNVWALGTRGTKRKHYAAFPLDIPAKCIKAGTMPFVCAECGTPWERMVKRKFYGNWNPAPGANGPLKVNAQKADRKGKAWENYKSPVYVAWRTTCGHPCRTPARAVALDPFGGTGTTAEAAQMLGRDALLIDLAGEYTAMARERVGGLFCGEAR